MKVRDLMTTDVKSCNSDTNLAAAASRMWEGDCGALPVVDDDGKFIGMITDRDICMAVATRPQLASDILVGEVTSGAIYVCHPTDEVQFALKTMQKERVRRLPVVNDKGILQGILSTNDIILYTEEGGDKGIHGDVLSTQKAICEHRSPKSAHQQGAPQKVTYAYKETAI
jgi:CBS domain-containing protein